MQVSFIDQAADDVIDTAQMEERRKLTQAYDVNSLGNSQHQILSKTSPILDERDERSSSLASGLGANH